MKFIVTTTIYKPSFAIKKYLTFTEWQIIIVGDKKTPEADYLELVNEHDNLIYLSVDYQETNHKEISEAIGWNSIQRRNIGFIEALKKGATVIASVDDDNIPLDNWGKNVYIGKPVDIYYYETDLY